MTRYNPEKVKTTQNKPKSFFSAPVGSLAARHSTGFMLGCFLLLALSNALLSYGDLSLSAKLWTCLLGLAAPFLALINFSPPQKDPWLTSSLPKIPLWAWLLLGLAAAFLRIFRLTDLFAWPILDEGVFGYFAAVLADQWDWKLVHCTAQQPTLYFWGLALFYKAFGVSLSNLWLFPALCSILCVPAAWLAARRAFSSPIAFIFTAWTAFGFWPLYLGRVSTEIILVVLLELLVFATLNRVLSQKDGASRGKAILILALLTGVGFYSYLGWPILALWVFLILLTGARRTFPDRLKTGLKFAGITALIALPLLLTFLQQYQGYLGHIWAAGTPRPWTYHANLAFSYFSDLFWGSGAGFFHYGPIWGGFFNPFLTSLFLVGLVSLAKSGRGRLGLWTLATLLLFSLPAVLTNNLEAMRLVFLLPVILGVCAIGTQFLLCFIPGPRRLPLFLLVLFGSVTLDSVHLFKVHPDHWMKDPSYYGEHKSREFYKAYNILKPIVEKEGPGAVLLNFHPDPYDQTLFVAAYGFNSAADPRLDAAASRWTAILANIHEQPYLAKKFPGWEWTWLSEKETRRDGGSLLGVVRVTAENWEILGRWVKADQSLKELIRLVMEEGVNPNQDRMLKTLEEAYPHFKGDRFLESRYWRIKALHHLAGGNSREAIEDWGKAIERGYPMAHLYNEMGCLMFKEGRVAEAEKAFRNALVLKPNLTDAESNLRNLLQNQERIEKN